MMLKKSSLKQVLGEIPLTAEIYWQLRQRGKPLSKSFSLKKVEQHLPGWRLQAGEALRQRNAHSGQAGKRVVIFATLRYWLEHAALLGFAMAGQGHRVALGFLPYANFRKPLNRFDLRRQNQYAQYVLRPASPLVNPVSLLDVQPLPEKLPEALQQAVYEVTQRDAQYILQNEVVDTEGALFRLRLERNQLAARAALAWLQVDGKANRPEVLLTPNGSILEFGAVYQAARFLNIPVVTYEFGEQRGRIWQARNAEVMRQETDALWQRRKDVPLTESQWEQVRLLFASRQGASLWENFSRLWQGQPSQGGEQARQALDLQADKPVALLAANVIGDSLTLGRQVFSRSMTEWLQRTAAYYAAKPEVQLVVRIHPGERYTKGSSVADVLRQSIPDLPANIRLVEASNPLNTYDLVEIADLVLVYTTTVGMEAAMSGAPVIVAGQTHYRGKGFTLDPGSWEEYFREMEAVLVNPASCRPGRAQVERAWQYAYRFFFEYPDPFPWHLLHFWNELEEWSLARVLGPEGQAQFGATFRTLSGEARTYE
jgi:hypothetical protein